MTLLTNLLTMMGLGRLKAVSEPDATEARDMMNIADIAYISAIFQHVQTDGLRNLE